MSKRGASVESATARPGLPDWLGIVGGGLPGVDPARERLGNHGGGLLPGGPGTPVEPSLCLEFSRFLFPYWRGVEQSPGNLPRSPMNFFMVSHSRSIHCLRENRSSTWMLLEFAI